MKAPLALFLLAVPFVLFSCASTKQPNEMTTKEYADAVNSKPVSGRQVKLEFRVRESSRGIRGSTEGKQVAMPTMIVKYGQTGKIEIVTEVIYPVAFDPAEASDDPRHYAVTPANPTKFVAKPVGLTIEARAEKKGAFIRVKGDVRFTAKTGMSKVPYGAGPLTTENQIAVTDNTVEFPRFVEYSTPFTLLLLPGKTYSFHVSHSSPGTMMGVTATPLP